MALTADKNFQSKGGRLFTYPVDGGSIIYKGALVCTNAAGFLVPAADTAGFSNCVGVADERVDNSAGADGALNCRVRCGERYLVNATSITQGMVGDQMFVVDDATFDDSAGVVNNIRAGILVEFVSATSGWILIALPAITPGTIGAGDIGAGAVTAVKLSATLKTGFIPLNITTGRIIAANVIQNTTEGGVPDGNTAPALARVNGAVDKALALTWIATGVEEVQFAPVLLPDDLDDTAAVIIHLMVDKDANMDAAAVIAVSAWFGVGDANAGGNTAAITELTPTEKTVSIAAGDVPAEPNFLNVSLIPGAHANDALRLYAAWVTYTRK